MGGEGVAEECDFIHVYYIISFDSPVCSFPVEPSARVLCQRSERFPCQLPKNLVQLPKVEILMVRVALEYFWQSKECENWHLLLPLTAKRPHQKKIKPFLCRTSQVTSLLPLISFHFSQVGELLKNLCKADSSLPVALPVVCTRGSL